MMRRQFFSGASALPATLATLAACPNSANPEEVARVLHRPAASLRRHPLIGYFALAYGVSWGGILIALSATGLVWQTTFALALSVVVAVVFAGFVHRGRGLRRDLHPRSKSLQEPDETARSRT
jgi:hypothetical protein